MIIKVRQLEIIAIVYNKLVKYVLRVLVKMIFIQELLGWDNLNRSILISNREVFDLQTSSVFSKMLMERNLITGRGWLIRLYTNKYAVITQLTINLLAEI